MRKSGEVQWLQYNVRRTISTGCFEGITNISLFRLANVPVVNQKDIFTGAARRGVGTDLTGPGKLIMFKNSSKLASSAFDDIRGYVSELPLV